MLVIIPVCAKDEALAIRNLERCIKLDSRADFVAIVSHDKGYNPTSVLNLAKTYFREVRDLTYNPCPFPDKWPFRQNWAWQATARAMSKQQESWFWWEADAVPLVASWIETISRAHASGGKPICGPHVDGQYVAGVAVYPSDVLAMNTNVALVKQAPWDVYAGLGYLRRSSNASPIIRHEKQPRSFTDQDAQEVAAWIGEGSVLYHKCKDGSLIDLLPNKPRHAPEPQPELQKPLSLFERTINKVLSNLVKRWKFAEPRGPDDRPIIVQLGRTGDIINVIPVARFYSTLCHHWDIPMVIHESKQAVVKRCSFIKAIPFHGTIDDREAAIEIAKKNTSNVLVPQLFNKKGADPASSVTPHFNTEQWEKCGVYDYWGCFPAEIDRRDWKEEKRIFERSRKTDKPLICYNLNAVSVPFPQKDALEKKILNRYRDCELLNLGTFNGEVSYTDILTFLDQCAALVTIDTSTVHLAQASFCPYVPIISTEINGWLSSKLRRRANLNLTYKDVMARENDLFTTLDNLIRQKYQTRKIVHCVQPRFNGNPRVQRAIDSWQSFYRDGSMIPAHIVSTCRNAKSIMGDKRDLPFMRDVLQAALLQASDNDILIFTNDDIVLTKEALRQIQLKLRYVDMVTGSRIDVEYKLVGPPNTLEPWHGKRHVGRDIIAWNTAWLRKNIDLIPDFILGASEWDIVFAALARHLCGIPSCMENFEMMFPECELQPGLIFHEKHDPEWRRTDNYASAPSQIHNQVMAEEWFRKNESRVEMFWFKRT